ncbi:MAG: DUF5050 domain-containing protein [Clostridia bacterium]|nr:DUF5050 domain-containing protein [Clostridia bacterium]
MKRFLAFVLLIGVACSVLLCFSSCMEPEKLEKSAEEALTEWTESQTAEASPRADPWANIPVVPVENEFTRSAGECIYRNYFFYTGTENGKYYLRYQDLNHVAEKGHPWVDDALASEGEKPFQYIAKNFFLVDEAATSRNEGHPILIIYYRYNVDGRPGAYGYRLSKFDTLTDKETVILENPPGGLIGFMLYKNTIYYTVNEGADGYSKYSVNTDGSDHKQIRKASLDFENIHLIYDDKIYYSKGTGKQLYRSNLDFTEEEYLLDHDSHSGEFVSEGYYYYCDRAGEMKVPGGDRIISTYNLYRRPLSDWKREGELVLENVKLGFGAKGRFIYHSSLDVGMRTDTVPDNGKHIVHVFDTKTLEDKKVYESIEEPRFLTIMSIESVDEKQIVLYCDNFLSGNEKTVYYTAVNLETGESQKVPR